jgi:hypothetical protein
MYSRQDWQPGGSASEESKPFDLIFFLFSLHVLSNVKAALNQP